MEHSSKPAHVAIIMDGNGRWATERSHLRMWGHVRGARVVSQIIEEAVNLNIKALTLYTFSTENWSRPKDEITTLFKLLRKFLALEKEKILRQNVKFRVMGEYQDFPKDVLEIIEEVREASKNNTGLKMTLALGYGSRNEIVTAVNKIIKQTPQKEICEQDIQNELFLPDLGDVDLMIRTGGDHRISNFLLWQMAYAELFFSETKWPNFKPKEFRSIIENFSQRERRFGNIDCCSSLGASQCEALKNKNNLLASELNKKVK